jgi:hypothetical protein
VLDICKRSYTCTHATWTWFTLTLDLPSSLHARSFDTGEIVSYPIHHSLQSWRLVIECFHISVFIAGAIMAGFVLSQARANDNYGTITVMGESIILRAGGLTFRLSQMPFASLAIVFADAGHTNMASAHRRSCNRRLRDTTVATKINSYLYVQYLVPLPCPTVPLVIVDQYAVMELFGYKSFPVFFIVLFSTPVEVGSGARKHYSYLRTHGANSRIIASRRATSANSESRRASSGIFTQATLPVQLSTMFHRRETLPTSTRIT